MGNDTRVFWKRCDKKIPSHPRPSSSSETPSTNSIQPKIKIQHVKLFLDKRDNLLNIWVASTSSRWRNFDNFSNSLECYKFFKRSYRIILNKVKLSLRYAVKNFGILKIAPIELRLFKSCQKLPKLSKISFNLW